MEKNVYSFAATLFIFFQLLSHQVVAQQVVQYDNKTFGDCETIEALIGNSGETFTIYIAEHELRPGYGGAYERSRGGNTGGDYIENMPKGYDIDIEVFFADGLKFPIKPEDNVVIDLSRTKYNLGTRENLSGQIDRIDDGAIKSKAGELTTKKLSAEDQAKAIAQQLQQGKISPDEAMKKMEAIQNAMLAEVENSGVMNTSIEEPGEPSMYGIHFMDTKEQVQSWIVNGKLRVVRFNEDEFVATISGEHYVECRERRAALSREEEMKCKQVESSIVPATKVLREGAVNLSINVKLKKFEDFRE